MLGIKKIAPGRMGNRLFHYHFLRQVAQKTNSRYFHTKFPEGLYFDEMGKKRKPFFQRFRRSIEISSKDILAYDPPEFLSFLNKENNKNTQIILSPPMLGEVFFDYLFFDPNRFIKIKEKYKLGPELDEDLHVLIGLHFRGTDFSAWNPKAALRFEYYKTAVNFCLEKYNAKNIIFRVFTDDYQFPAYIKTVAYLKSLKSFPIHYGDKDVLPIYDFYQMTQCDVLISSPSTFAIFAGILGRNKKIIHNKRWLEYAVNQEDTFWVKLVNTNNPFYSLWRSF